MALTPQEIDTIRMTFLSFYVFQCQFQQALIHVLCQKLNLPFEAVEREVNEWVSQHPEAAIPAQREAYQVLKSAGYPDA